MAEDARFWEPFSERGFTPDSAGPGCCPGSSAWCGPRAAAARPPAPRRRGGRLGPDPRRGAQADSLDAEVEALVDRLAGGPTVALGLTKWLLRSGQTAPLDAHLQDEALALELSSRSEDFREGLVGVHRAA